MSSEIAVTCLLAAGAVYVFTKLKLQIKDHEKEIIRIEHEKKIIKIEHEHEKKMMRMKAEHEIAMMKMGMKIQLLRMKLAIAKAYMNTESRERFNRIMSFLGNRVEDDEGLGSELD